MDHIPNHVCKNPHCTKGADGGPLHYWACNDCDKRESWKAAACSEECYEQYVIAIKISRGELDAEAAQILDIAAEDTIPETEVPAKQPVFFNYGNKNKHYH